MKVLLLAPPLENMQQTTFDTRYKDEVGQRPPLGLLYVATYLSRNSRHTVKVIDCYIDRLSYPQVKEKVREFQPDVVGILALTFTLIDVLKTAAAVKECSRDISVVLGGPHPSIYPKESLAHPDIDYVVRKEGEYSFARLIEHVGDFAGLEAIPGIGFKKGGIPVLTADPVQIDDLDRLPLPDRSFLPYPKYRSVFARRSPSTIMMTSRGCPHNCIFCERMGKKFRSLSPGKVIEEIEECLSLGIRDISFADDTFTVDKGRVREICSLIRKRRLRFDWDIKTRVDAVDYALLREMKQAGCGRVNFGVESASPRILDLLRKGITKEQIEQAFSWSNKLGIKALAFLMIGSPFETPADIEETFRFVRTLKAEYMQFSITVPCPGTDLYRELLEKGVIKKDVWREFALAPYEGFKLPLAGEQYTHAKLQATITGLYKRYYFTPRFIFRELSGVRSSRMLLAKARTGMKLLMQAGA